MRPNHVKQGHWSPHENSSGQSKEVMLARTKAKAAERGGRILTEHYKNSTTKLECQDAAGNRFWMSPNHILTNHWSPYEAKVVRDPVFHLTELARIAESRGGKLLSTVYVDSASLLEFEDAAGNRFKSLSGNIKKGQWSPFEGTVSEHVCRQAVEYLFGALFPSRWDVVRRPNGNKLQLDGYAEGIRTAFEYQGVQHQTDEGVMQRDAEKRTACRELGIMLVEVHRWYCLYHW